MTTTIRTASGRRKVEQKHALARIEEAEAALSAALNAGNAVHAATLRLFDTYVSAKYAVADGAVRIAMHRAATSLYLELKASYGEHAWNRPPLAWLDGVTR